MNDSIYRAPPADLPQVQWSFKDFICSRRWELGPPCEDIVFANKFEVDIFMPTMVYGFHDKQDAYDLDDDTSQVIIGIQMWPPREGSSLNGSEPEHSYVYGGAWTVGLQAMGAKQSYQHLVEAEKRAYILFRELVLERAKKQHGTWAVMGTAIVPFRYLVEADSEEEAIDEVKNMNINVVLQENEWDDGRNEPNVNNLSAELEDSYE